MQILTIKSPIKDEKRTKEIKKLLNFNAFAVVSARSKQKI